jgi:hypothetical protein
MIFVLFTNLLEENMFQGETFNIINEVIEVVLENYVFQCHLLH